jgi:hypothetical protein
MKRGLPPTPPDKGSFPLDHFGTCREPQLQYLQCVREGKQKTTNCKEIMKGYLECRMQNGLMAKEDLNALGFRQQQDEAAAASTTAPGAKQ